MQPRSTTFILLSAVIVGIAHPSWAGADRAPALTEATLAGRWEAIGDQDPRLFVLTIDASGRALLAVAVAPEPIAVAVYRVDHLSVQRGKIDAVFAEANGEKLQVSGRGFGNAESGVIDAAIFIRTARGKVVQKWKLRFVHWPKGYVSTLRELADRAEMQIKAAESGNK